MTEKRERHFDGGPSPELIHEGRNAAEVTIELEDSDDLWSPTMSVEDGLRLEQVRDALRRGDHAEAAKDAKVFELLPLAE